MSAAATPGPWEVNTLGGPVKREVFSVSDTLICDCGCSNVEMETEEIEANARLIAAAPDLLEALKMVADQINGSYRTAERFECEEIKQINAAIAKAEGK